MIWAKILHAFKSPDPEQIERNFVHRFFAFDSAKCENEPNFIKEAICSRLENRINSEQIIKDLFKVRFAGWEKAITPAEELQHLLRSL